MSRSENEVAADDASKFNVEFRSHDDEAWYSVRVVLEQEEVLRLKFLNFGDSHDKVFEAQCFNSLKEVEEFEKRFRPVSLQLQDDECRSIIPGTTVCACYQYNSEDVRFYDATVVAVQEKEHSFNGGEEECLCTYTLLWLHGPVAGIYSNATVADVCKIQPTSGLDPVVASFLKIARERTKVTANSISFSKGASGLEVVQPCNGSQNIKQKSSFLERLYMDARCTRRSISKNPSSCENRIAKLLSKRLEDRDLGGKKNLFMILVGNLDKTLSPPTIEEFLYRHISVSPRVYIFPSLSSELFTRGAFVFDSKGDFEKLHNFLNDPTQIVMSSTGRPWVMTEEVVGLKNIKASIGTLMPASKNKTLQKECDGKRTDLKIVRVGTREFKMASDLRDIFMEFSAHQRQLHQRLAFEERMLPAIFRSLHQDVTLKSIHCQYGH
ncbi:uncharacterized protein LOC114717638 [Neltuma alba]|uniref:uncharacterized protein LOC114717638 n=1 Tax=Neltuma alba TaxID=207710 RepID=UPI0010A336A1|nr:uncharacterized protein LOC114717638 [Prosopis alba]